MSRGDLIAKSTDGRVKIIASSVYMLANALGRARDGDYPISRELGVNRVNGETKSTRYGLATVTTFADATVVDIRVYSFFRDPPIKRRIRVKFPPRDFASFAQ